MGHRPPAARAALTAAPEALHRRRAARGAAAEAAAVPAPAVEGLKQALPGRDVNRDETGWKQAGQRCWLWAAVTPLFTVFHLAFSRGRAVVEALLGASYSGVLTADRWSACGRVGRQLCRALLGALQGGDERVEEGVQARQQAVQQAGRDRGVETRWLQADTETLIHWPTPSRRMLATKRILCQRLASDHPDDTVEVAW